MFSIILKFYIARHAFGISFLLKDPIETSTGLQLLIILLDSKKLAIKLVADKSWKVNQNVGKVLPSSTENLSIKTSNAFQVHFAKDQAKGWKVSQAAIKLRTQNTIPPFFNTSLDLLMPRLVFFLAYSLFSTRAQNVTGHHMYRVSQVRYITLVYRTWRNTS